MTAIWLVSCLALKSLSWSNYIAVLDAFGYYLFILKMTILGLDVMKLVSQSNEVLVSLLDLKNLSLKLGDQEIFLVASKMNTIVVLYA